ncbi:phosphatase PAP2 family protein [Streptomyces pathocidini]|uniref:Phosphatase PAP2 family protein n=1 Tax=Streptomyces pathocidini TaxID=1650571 RepID=A0ABW7UL95_9ACTN|nr:phosphatase PAP2 family protein [Streptomyces pathocidini]
MDPPPPSRSPALCLSAAAVCGLLFGVVLGLVAAEWSPLLSWDRTVADDLHGSARTRPGWVTANRILTDWVWDPWTLRALLVLAALWLLWRGDRFTAAWILLAAVSGSLLQQALKWAVDRPRPQWENPVDTAPYMAFPSGHAMTAALVCPLLVWLLAGRDRGSATRGRRLATAAAAAAAAVSILGVGFTRVYLGVHWFSDVLGGWLLGGALAALTAAVCTLRRTAP